jgi:hypothetical protein
MKTLGWIGTLAAGVALIAAAAQAQSTKTPEQRRAHEAARLSEHVIPTNRECGTSMTAAFDWTGVNEEELLTQSANGWCESALEGIRRVCGDDAGKDAVKEQIKSLTCGFGPERRISLKDGTVNFTISFKSTNDTDFVFESLENAL